MEYPCTYLDTDNLFLKILNVCSCPVSALLERVIYLLFEYHVLGYQPSVDLVCPVPIGLDLLDHALEHLLQQFFLNILPLECQTNVVQDLGSLVLRLLQGGGR